MSDKRTMKLDTTEKQTDPQAGDTIRTVEQGYTNAEMLTINMGPQHPSTHGVLRLIVDLDGESVVRVQPVVGYLHSGKEKIAEVKTYQQFIPYTDRLDYLAPMAYNTGYVMTIEKLLGIEITEACTYLRTILCELARISSHLIFFAAHLLELGASSPFMYAFRDREYLYDLFEEISGARFTVSYMRVGGVARPIPDGWLDRVIEFCDYLPGALADYERLLNNNEIFLQRTWGIGKISAEEAIALGVTGPLLRASGVPWDLRKKQPYLLYDQLDWDVVVDDGCDVYARYIVRLREIRESLKIVRQCVDKFPGGPLNIDNPKVILPPRERLHTSMEALIHHFLLMSEGMTVRPGEVYQAIEAPKGELGFYLVSDGTTKAYRLKIRTPSFSNLQAIDIMCRGAMLADIVAVIGSLDLVLGDIDR
jgi:NADH-quinone oxidoreductase subunit D